MEKIPDERVLFEHNPIHEVICQLRYPEILRMRTEEPAEFQEIIRLKSDAGRAYTDYKTRREMLIPEQVGTIVPGLSDLTRTITTHDFASSADRASSWIVSLNPSFIALRAGVYERWEEFEDELTRVLSIFEKIYKPSFYERIGLRYVNYIQRSRLSEIENDEWSELLRPELLGELGLQKIDGIGNVTGGFRRTVLNLEGLDSTLLQHGIAEFKGESVYVIDCDFYCEGETEVGHASSKLQSFNKKAGSLFRWCISPKLYRAMGPKPATHNRAKSA